MATFSDLLKEFRTRAGLSQRALARASGINAAIISRLETGDRQPSGPEQVLAVVRALQLDGADGDLLLASAGYWPRSVLSLGPQDESLLAIAGVLSDPAIDEESKSRFRHTIRLLAEQWTARKTP